MVADLVRGIGGERVNVIQLMGPGVDPHLYRSTRDDVLSMRQSQLVLYNGLMLEGKLTDTLKRMHETVRAVPVAEVLTQDQLINPAGEDGHPDPHVWMDPSLWTNCVEVVRTELTALSPNDAEVFQANANSYRKEVERLLSYGRTAIESVPAEQRVLITSHDAFGYFGRAFGFDVHAIQGISTESEASLQRINQLVDLIVTRKVGAVFVESSVPARSIQSLIDGAAARGHRVVIGGELFSDAMGTPGTYEGTYIGMLDHNITRIVKGLGGNVPEQGMNQKLSSSSATPAGH